MLTEQMTSLLTSCHIQHVCLHYKKCLFYSDLRETSDQQSCQRLTQTSERMRFGRWWSFWAYYV